MAPVLAGLDWDITIRGIAVVATGFVVLMGSVWLLLATNTGTRLGTLIAGAGFFGWMVIMAIIWWMFGGGGVIGWQGRPPSWKVLDVNYAQLEQSPVESARSLTPVDQLTFPGCEPPTPDDGSCTIPSAHELVVRSGNEVAIADFDTIPEELTTALADAQAIEDPELREKRVEAAQRAIDDRELRNETVTFSEVAAVAPELTDDIDFGGDWRLLSTAEAGEASTTASAELVELGIFGDPSEFKVLDSFDVGGKSKLPDDPNRWDRIAHEVYTIAHFWHPAHYAVIQVQPVIEQETEEGQAPPRPVVDENQPVISVVMVRDLGSRRLTPALVTIGSTLLFAAFATMLHYRDKESMARRAALAEKK
jgi:hypothetical protein